MKIHTTSMQFRTLAATLALAAPSLGWATDHFLYLTGIASQVCSVTQVSQAVVNGSTGAVSTALVLNGLQAKASTGSDCTNLNNNVSFTGTLTLEYKPAGSPAIKRCLPGTKTQAQPGGQLEWLDEGNPILGVYGNLNATTADGATYRVAIPGGTYSVQDVSGTCTTLGQNNYTFTRDPITISKTASNGGPHPVLTTTTLATAGLLIPSPNKLPEPGTLSLIGLGLAALGWRRARKSHANLV